MTLNYTLFAFAGDSDALVEQALKFHTVALRTYARRLTRDGSDADDLVQDTMMRCWSARTRFEPGTNFIAWSRTIMKNSFLAARYRDRFHGDLPENAYDRLPGIDGGQELAVIWQEVLRALAELTPEHRAAVLLAGEGVSIDDGARRCGILANTYKTRISRGRAQLRKLVENPRAKAVHAVEIQKKSARRTRPLTGIIIG